MENASACLEKNQFYWFPKTNKWNIIHNENTLIYSTAIQLFICMLFRLNGNIKLIKKKKNRLNTGYTEFFLQKSNGFITTSSIGHIRIWGQDEQKEWKIKKIMHAAYEPIQQLIINVEENIIVSSIFNHIYIWSQAQDWKCIQTIKLEKDFIICFCLSQNGQKIISLGFLSQIYVYELNDQKEWQVLQKIKENGGQGLSFISNDLFCLRKSEKLVFYQFQNNENQFIKISKIRIPILNNQIDYQEIEGLHYNFQLFFMKIGYLMYLMMNDQKVSIYKKSRVSLAFKQVEIIGINRNFKKLLKWNYTDCA